jgi:hypothetical protein
MLFIGLFLFSAMCAALGYLIAVKEAKVPAPTAETAALEPTPVRPPLSVIDPVLLIVLPA